MNTPLNNTILVTGGAGFIGSNFVVDWIHNGIGNVITLDKLTYAGNLHNLSRVSENRAHTFIHGDIQDRTLVASILNNYKPRAIINFAAESHVDRSIHSPEDFIQTNITGTFHLLEEARIYWKQLLNSSNQHQDVGFRFLHISTDEVYGSLNATQKPFTEKTPYAPNSPYSASKAAADHLVRSYHQTYGLPTLTTICSNNYGPNQFPEKLIPLFLLNAISGKPLPLYGDGQQIRDWLYVLDHCNAIRQVLKIGKPGEVYNIGGGNEKTNLDVARTLCDFLDNVLPKTDGLSYQSQITFVKDRPGHDHRYAIDASKMGLKLGWKPQETFLSGIQKTISWYLKNPAWIESVTSGEYRSWINTHYKEESK